MYVCVWAGSGVSTSALFMEARAIRYLGSGESCNMGSGKQTQVFCKTSAILKSLAISPAQEQLLVRGQRLMQTIFVLLISSSARFSVVSSSE